MADIQYVNPNFIQRAAICAVASYGTIIQYYSSDEISVENVLTRYLDHFKIRVNAPKGKMFQYQQKAITKHFHQDYCGPKNMRGFDFIKIIHNSNLFGTNLYCQITASQAYLHAISQEELTLIENEIKNEEALAMILYKVNAKQFHAVIIGYDPIEEEYFYKDPEKAKIIKRNLLHSKEIWEFLIFNDN